MSGAEAAAYFVGKGAVRRTRGRDCYHPETRTVFLSEETWGGSDAWAVYRALHEAGHARQHEERPVWFSLRNLKPVRVWIEWDAWRRAGVWLRRLGWEPADLRERRNKELGSYL